MGKISWTNAAVDDLQLAREYAAASSATNAAALVQRIIAKTHVLESFPVSAEWFPSSVIRASAS